MNVSVISECLKYYELRAGEIGSLNLTGIDLCAKYTLMSYGAIEINKRMKRWVNKKQRQLMQDESDLKVIYFDAFSLYENRCQYSRQTDGRHYQAIEAVQTVALMNIVNNYC